MNLKKSISIACASAFWGDTPYAVGQLLREPNLDYIAFDYLSEVTMTLLARFKKKDESLGYVPDFLTDVIEPHLKTCLERKIKLISNAGAMNPLGLKKKIEDFAQAQGLKVKILCVEGDDLLKAGHIGESVKDMSGKTWPGKAFISANAYLGAPALVQALAEEPDILITGRTVDTALIVAPAVYAFQWKWDDYDQLAQASLAGHIVECGTQCTGGNFTDWNLVPKPEDMGFPILRFNSNGEFTVTKAPNTGGLISAASVAEQIVYEIGNPAAYILPDVICDFTQVSLNEKNGQVTVRGARGIQPTSTYKASATLQEGWKISATAFMAGGDAKAKALAVGKTILKRCAQFLAEKSLAPYSETRIETLGGGVEVLLRISAAHENIQALEVLAKEIAPAATSLAPGLTNLLGGRASPSPRIRLVNLLIEKDKLAVEVCDGSTRKKVEIPKTNGKLPETKALASAPVKTQSASITLSELAYARSGDKGNDANIGLIARNAKAYEIIKKSVTPETVARFFAEDFDSPKSSEVLGWDMPGIKGLNFLVKNCLGGGGSYSLKVDPQGKAFAQRLLQMQVPVSKEVL